MNTSQWCSALWEQFRLFPWQVQAALLLALVLLLVGLVVVSLGAGRVAGWAGSRILRRRNRPSAAAPADPFARVLALKPSAVRREFQALIDADAAADSEGAR